MLNSPMPSTPMTETRRLAEALIARPSVTPQDTRCIDLIANLR